MEGAFKMPSRRGSFRSGIDMIGTGAMMARNMMARDLIADRFVPAFRRIAARLIIGPASA
jgi:hypothetical protein